jgi:UDP-N-acetylglucosamine:LPS N-acetylglucosamine transferase
VELLRIAPAFKDASVHYVTVRSDYRADVPDHKFYTVRDATRWNPIGAAVLSVQVFFLVLKLRPDVVISTGAAPGYFAVRFGKVFKARTIWVDSLANVDQLSKSGKLVGKFADLWLTQWPELAKKGGPDYAGQVL